MICYYIMWRTSLLSVRKWFNRPSYRVGFYGATTCSLKQQMSGSPDMNGNDIASDIFNWYSYENKV
jgi:hypothetical protein